MERDRPLWLGAGDCPPVPPRAAARGTLRRLVLAVHYPWYGTPDGPTGRWRHWNHARLEMPEGRIRSFHDPRRAAGPERLDIGATHYPDGGPYDSRDPARIRDPAGAGSRGGAGRVRGLLVGSGERGRAGPRRALPRTRARLAWLLAPYYETGELWRRGALAWRRTSSSLLDRHGREPAWLRVGGIPVVFLYASHRLRPRAWDAVRARLRRQGDVSTSSVMRRAPSGWPCDRTGSSASTPSTSTRRSCFWRGAGS